MFPAFAKTQKKVKGNSPSKEKPKITNTTNDNQKSKSKQKQQPTYIPKKTYNTYTHPVHPFSELFYDDTDKFYYNNNMLHYNNNHYAKKRTNQYTPIKRNPLQNLQTKKVMVYQMMTLQEKIKQTKRIKNKCQKYYHKTKLTNY